MNERESIELAEKTLADILSFFGVNADIVSEYSDGVIELDVASSELNSLLIGKNAETLRSLQMLISSVLRSKQAEITRVNVDIADYKKQRAEKLVEKAKEWFEVVLESGESRYEKLNAADRRVVHKAAQEFGDIITESEGEGRDRRIVISKRS